MNTFWMKKFCIYGNYSIASIVFFRVWVTVWVRRKSPHVQHSESPPSARSDKMARNLHTAGIVPAAQRGQKP